MILYNPEDPILNLKILNPSREPLQRSITTQNIGLNLKPEALVESFKPQTLNPISPKPQTLEVLRTLNPISPKNPEPYKPQEP